MITEVEEVVSDFERSAGLEPEALKRFTILVIFAVETS